MITEASSPTTALPKDMQVLYIDDDSRLLSLVEGQLAVHGVKVLTASSAQEGLRLLEEAGDNRPQVILCDVMMPSEDGYSFHQRVRSNPQWLQIPFIYVTALGEDTDYRKGMNLGADGYLSKPFNQEALVTEIQHVLQRLELVRDEERVEIHLVGGQNVRLNNSLSKAPDRGAEQLVFYLIIQATRNGQVVRRRRNDIMAALWQDITLSGFRSVLSRAKRWSEGWSEWHVTNKEVFFNLHENIWCDLYEIEKILAEEGGVSALEKLYSGVLLPNYQEDWVQSKREALASRVKMRLLTNVREDMHPRERAFALKSVLRVDPEDYSLWENYIESLEIAGLQHEADQAKASLEGQS